MLEQEHVDLVIMLCSVRENGKVKCDQYWPLEVSETLVFEEFKVTLASVE
jgi:protein tyrosine phosphatase